MSLVPWNWREGKARLSCQGIISAWTGSVMVSSSACLLVNREHGCSGGSTACSGVIECSCQVQAWPANQQARSHTAEEHFDVCLYRKAGTAQLPSCLPDSQRPGSTCSHRQVSRRVRFQPAQAAAASARSCQHSRSKLPACQMRPAQCQPACPAAAPASRCQPAKLQVCYKHLAVLPVWVQMQAIKRLRQRSNRCQTVPASSCRPRKPPTL